MAAKRPAGEESNFATKSKRIKTGNDALPNEEGTLDDSGLGRTSTLPSPTMKLQGHQGEVYTCQFHPDGEVLLTGSSDRTICIWSVFEKCKNLMTLTGHTGSVMEAHFSQDGDHIFSCSTDRTVAVWDTFTGSRLRQLIAHYGMVNTVNSTKKGVSLLCSGSDDRTVRIWDERVREPVHTISTGYQVTSACFNITGDEVIYAGMSTDLALWDFRKNEILYNLKGHTEPITGISLSPDGSCVLSNSMDNSVRIWNINRSADEDRCIRKFEGNHNYFADNLLRCAWAKDCSKIAAGSADCETYVWNYCNVLYKMPGPKGSVNDVDFHPKQPIIASATSDENVYMCEIDD